MTVNGDSVQILRVPRRKRIVLRLGAIVLFTLGVLPAAWVSLLLHSILPFLGGLFLAFLAYHLVKASNLVLEIGREGVTLGDTKRRWLTRWSEIVEFSQGSGVDRHKVAMTCVSDPMPRRINLGLFGLECRRVRYLPDTFGMKAIDLADLLKHAKDKYAETIGQSGDVDAKS
jgi:hypothetical protein